VGFDTDDVLKVRRPKTSRALRTQRPVAGLGGGCPQRTTRKTRPARSRSNLQNIVRTHCN